MLFVNETLILEAIFVTLSVTHLLEWMKPWHLRNTHTTSLVSGNILQSTFLLRLLPVIPTVPIFFNYFYLLTLVTLVVLPPMENSDNIVSVSTDFPSTGHVTKISVASDKLLVQELISQW